MKKLSRIKNKTTGFDVGVQYHPTLDINKELPRILKTGILTIGGLAITAGNMETMKATHIRRFVLFEKREIFEHPITETIHSIRMSLGF